MGKILKSSVYRAAGLAVAAAIAASGVACTDARPTVPTVTELPDAGRHPDGVLVETPPAVPSASVRGEARGIVALREPVGVEGIEDTVLGLVGAVQAEDLAGFEAQLLPDCAAIDAGSPGARGSRSMIVERFRRRMADLDFSRLAGMELVRPERIQTSEYDEIAPPTRPQVMRPGDVFVRVPMEVSRIGADKFYGDVWLLVLRRVEGSKKYKVAAFGEIDSGS